MIVTAHAVRRYAERVLGIEIDETLDDAQALADLRARGIDTAEISVAIREICSTGVREGAVGVRLGGVRYRLSGESVVTVLPKQSPLHAYEGRAL